MALTFDRAVFSPFSSESSMGCARPHRPSERASAQSEIRAASDVAATTTLGDRRGISPACPRMCASSHDRPPRRRCRRPRPPRRSGAFRPPPPASAASSSSVSPPATPLSPGCGWPRRKLRRRRKRTRRDLVLEGARREVSTLTRIETT